MTLFIQGCERSMRNTSTNIYRQEKSKKRTISQESSLNVSEKEIVSLPKNLDTDWDNFTTENTSSHCSHCCPVDREFPMNASP